MTVYKNKLPLGPNFLVLQILVGNPIGFLWPDFESIIHNEASQVGFTIYRWWGGDMNVGDSDQAFLIK